MEKFLGAIRRQVSEFLEKTSKKQKIWFSLAVAAVIVLGVAAALVLGRVQYTVLYSGLVESEAGEIMALLNERGVSAKAQGTSTILVPTDGAEELRMELAAGGYPQSGLNYDIFSSASGFGTTDLEKQTYLQYQLQDNLRTTIMKLDKIKDCMVIVNMATESSFVLSSDEKKASASIMLELDGGSVLSPREAMAIGELVTKSVPDLELDNVRIIDSKMNLYDLSGSGSDEQYTTTQYELTERVRDTLSEQVLAVLTPAFGRANVSAAVNVVLNFDQETVNTVEFATPVEGEDDGLIVSMEELYERALGGTGAAGTAGTDSNGVAASEYGYDDATAGDCDKISRTVNYELNETRTQIEKAKGHIDNLSVAILLNSLAVGEDYVENVRNLVAKAIGVDEEYISVESLPFSGADDSGTAEVFLSQKSMLDSLKNKELMKSGIIAVVIMFMAFLAFKLLRSSMGGFRSPKTVIASTVDGVDILIGDETGEQELSLKDINIQKSANAKQIEKFVDKDPKAVAQLLRNWLSDDR